MAIPQPIASDPLSSPDHSLQHRIMAADTGASAQAFTVGPDNTVTATAGITCKSPVSIAPLGAELVLNGTFVSDLSNWTYGGGVDWTWDAAGKALHATGNVTPITQDIVVVASSDYILLITCSGRTAGSFGITLGGISFYNINTTVFDSNAIFTATVKSSGSGTQTFSITPTTGFDGKIDDISLKQVTGDVTSGLRIKDDSDAISYQVNSDAGLNSIGIGLNAGIKNVLGTGNVFVGNQAGVSNVIGSNNVFLGYCAGYSVTGGSNNLFIGTQAGYSTTLGNQNCFFGYNAGYSNTTGYQNLFFGYNAGFSNTVGYYNSFFGLNAGYFTTTGIQNVLFGLNAGLFISTGSNNVCIGVTAGVFQSDGGTGLSTPENSIYIGQNAKSGSDPAGGEDDITNETVIGYNATGDGANTTTLGNTSTLVTKVFGDIQPGTDNTYYLGKNDDDSPRAYKGIILKDTTNGTYYRIEIINGTITATSLTD